MRLESDTLVVVFSDGWHETEVATEGAGREWQWSKKEATLSFRNPKRGVRLFLQADQPVKEAFSEPQRVEMRIGPDGGRQLHAAARRSELRRTDISGRVSSARQRPSR